ncbi:unnamed protein product [Dimorphilus gyrociliatus]|uniref:Uncharacterized protein n=1 Tax=Dimorphilus gyrociliatus TaxID=2664684 RepID=A0A7I8VN65_9ANNE|nr:unnamed protein product [Dimorphilus gyrociliatus]
MAEDDKIFCTLRVHDSDGSTAHVYNGISANSWLTPIGIGKRATPPLHIACVDTVRQRAQSANSILGRRHYELERQQFDEKLIGTSLINNGPKMSIRNAAPIKIYERPSIDHYTADFELNIKQLIAPSTEQRRCISAFDLRQTRFSSAKKMREAFFRRAKPISGKEISEPFEDLTALTPAGVKKVETRPKTGFGIRIGKGPSLKPLMYNAECADCSCPYGCKPNCSFRACLASSDYMEGNTSSVNEESNNLPINKLATERKRRMKIIRREMPLLDK